MYIKRRELNRSKGHSKYKEAFRGKSERKISITLSWTRKWGTDNRKKAKLPLEKNKKKKKTKMREIKKTSADKTARLLLMSVFLLRSSTYVK